MSACGQYRDSILERRREQKLGKVALVMRWRWLIFFALAIAVVECGAAAILRIPKSPLAKFVWNPDLQQARDRWDTTSTVVDDEIGGYRSSGFKQNSKFLSGPSCGSAYGDSFVGGADVADDKGWVEQLSDLLGCRVANYAVGGYGTDQAFLLFRQIHDDSSFVLLGINPNNVEDNVNQYDAFLGSALDPTALKGRFLLDANGHLDWYPRPHLGREGFIAMNKNPSEILPHSYFLPDTRDGPVTLRLPYTLTLARVAIMARLHNILVRRAEWSGMYVASHPSGALRLMVAICQAFAKFAEARGQRPLVVILPISESFREQANYGQFEYTPLVAALQAHGIEVFDPGLAMIESAAGHSICEFFTRAHPEAALLTSPVACSGHYSVFGNTTIARLVWAELKRRDLAK
jgi:hypothetical protein